MGNLLFEWTIHALKFVLFVSGLTLIIGAVLTEQNIPNTSLSEDSIGITDQIFIQTYQSWRNNMTNSTNQTSTQNGRSRDQANRQYLGESFYTEIFILKMVTYIGSSLIFLSLTGCCISSSSHPMYIFAHLNATVVAIAIFAKVYNNISLLIFRSMKDDIIHYSGINDRSVGGYHFNAIMLNKSCCGVNNYKDFNQLENWRRDIQNYDMSRLFDLQETGHGFFPGKALSDYSDYHGEFVEYLKSMGCRINDVSKLISCDWMTADNVLTPATCCRRLGDVFQGCHLKGSANSTNNNMRVGCAKLMLNPLEGIYADIDTLFIAFFSILSPYNLLLICLFIMRQFKDSDEKFVPISIEIENILSGDENGSEIVSEESSITNSPTTAKPYCFSACTQTQTDPVRTKYTSSKSLQSSRYTTGSLWSVVIPDITGYTPAASRNKSTIRERSRIHDRRPV